jgi:electron transfer flavoprotein alpha/beta subunit
VVVHRLIEDGYQRLRVQLPAVLGISSETNEPRYPPVKGKMAAGRTMIPGWKAADIGLGAVSPKVELRRLQIQVRDARAELIPGASAAEQGAALADKLHEAGLL